MTDHYPDCDPDTLGDLKSIERLPAMKSPAPKISWGEDYKSRTVEERIEFSEKLANSMNHAADILQQERNGLLEVVEKQEVTIRRANKALEGQASMMQQELQTQNAKQQELNTLIVELQRTIKEQKKLLKSHGIVD